VELDRQLGVFWGGRIWKKGKGRKHRCMTVGFLVGWRNGGGGQSKYGDEGVRGEVLSSKTWEVWRRQGSPFGFARGKKQNNINSY